MIYIYDHMDDIFVKLRLYLHNFDHHLSKLEDYNGIVYVRMVKHRWLFGQNIYDYMNKKHMSRPLGVKEDNAKVNTN